MKNEIKVERRVLWIVVLTRIFKKPSRSSLLSSLSLSLCISIVYNRAVRREATRTRRHFWINLIRLPPLYSPSHPAGQEARSRFVASRLIGTRVRKGKGSDRNPTMKVTQVFLPDPCLLNARSTNGCIFSPQEWRNKVTSSFSKPRSKTFFSQCCFLNIHLMQFQD